MITLIFILSIQIASNEPVLIEAHPDCVQILQPSTGLTYDTETDLWCINANDVFKDLISKKGFESE